MNPTGQDEARSCDRPRRDGAASLYPANRRRARAAATTPNVELLLILENKLCDDLQAKVGRLRAKNRGLRAKNKFHLDCGSISVDVAEPGSATIYATGTLSLRRYLELESSGRNIVNVNLEATEDAAFTLGSLLVTSASAPLLASLGCEVRLHPLPPLCVGMSGTA